ncbi:zinc finger BED domain-containing protein RICESLEEPER 2-like [Solanum dulcamara]|uniref:zinc finger BED domain-containing protein RICESLEEPER 2-like n=1 Tax=Solanum dulcamara TaxID=45834 RepID=UPI002484D8EE|nr:zinc finger BED domain-containing protein RICESLEEPER 2-like [Solanum dulcamara]
MEVIGDEHYPLKEDEEKPTMCSTPSLLMPAKFENLFGINNGESDGDGSNGGGLEMVSDGNYHYSKRGGASGGNQQSISNYFAGDSANDSAIKNLKRRIEDWKGGILGNEFLHVRCNAHILNLIVKEGLGEQNESTSRVRNAIKYVKSFVKKVKIDTHGLLTLDIETRWNSTYMMLDTTVKFERAFSKMYDDDHKYLKYCLETNNVGGHPSIDDWKNVKVFINFLEIFYQVTLKFLGISYVTSNSFFHEIFNLQKIICKYVRSEDSILSGLAKKMELKFNKYWGTFESMNKLLFIAVVMDPRYKLKYVEYLFKNSYGCLVGAEKSKKVMDTLSRLYDYYMSSFYEDNTENKSELEKYLVDDLEKTKELDILAWWKISSTGYPIISRMERDVLSIPISTVASESTFSIGGRILDSYRSSLSPKTVEALICTQQ